MTRLTRLALTLGVALTVQSRSVEAENWPGWRGPRGDGSSSEANVPSQWSSQQNIVWKVPIPGDGHASPVIWGDRIFLVTAMTEPGDRPPDRRAGNSPKQPSQLRDRVLLCLDRSDGRELWRRTVVSAPLEGRHRLNSWASSTPATDGQRVYVTFLDGSEIVVAAYDFLGNQLWLARPGAFHSVHGFCSSPVLYNDKVIVNGDHDGDAYLVALDRSSGRTIWKIDRENKTRSYCVPLIRELDGRTQMILSGSKCVASYDPDTGERYWIVDGPTEQFVASLVVNKGLVFVTGGYPDHHLLAIRPAGRGNVTDSQIVWRDTRGVSYVPSPIASGEYFLVVSDDGVASCLDATTGKRHWMERIGKHFSASLVSAGGLVYFLDDDGVTTVVRPGVEFEVVAKNELGENCYASPAISNGQIFIRGEKHLYCIGSK